MEEIWKDIEGYEGLYQVSNLGRVKSLRFGKEKILKQTVNSRGYINVTLCVNGNKKTRKVHQLVATAFLDHKPCGYELVVDHIDDDPSNNRVDNLQIVTQRFNTCKTQGKYSSKYKGVNRNKFHNKWQSRIRINGNQKHLGYFDSEEEAHEAYQKALKDLENKK